MIYHKHLILNSIIKKPLTNESEAQEFLVNLVSAIEMKPLIDPVAKYVTTPGNRGMTAIVLIETSHIAFHIWDETEPFIRMDIYTCGTLDEQFALKLLDDQFGLIKPIWWLLDRADGIDLMKCCPVQDEPE